MSVITGVKKKLSQLKGKEYIPRNVGLLADERFGLTLKNI